MTYIDISKKDLDIYIQKNGIENTIKNIINIIRNEKLGFPYKKYFIESVKMCQEKYRFELIVTKIVSDYIH